MRFDPRRKATHLCAGCGQSTKSGDHSECYKLLTTTRPAVKKLRASSIEQIAKRIICNEGR